MISTIRKLAPILKIASFTVISVVLGTAAVRADQSNSSGRKLVNELCTSCHGLAPIEATRNGPAGWRDTVFNMVVAGAQIMSQSELDTIANYLSTAYGPASGQMHTGPLPAETLVRSEGTTASDYAAILPTGKGAVLVKSYCSICHDLGRVVATRRSDEEWGRYTRVMLAKGGLPASQKVRATIAAYLDANFGISEQKPQQRRKSAAIMNRRAHGVGGADPSGAD